MRRGLVRGACAGVAALVVVLVPAAEAAGPYSFYSVSPCRVVDTRWPTGPNGGPALQANSTRDFQIAGSCTIPLTAQAVAFNVTIAAPTDYGDLRIYPKGTPMPNASVINFMTTDTALANGAIVPLGSGGVSVRCDMPAGSTGSVDLILDVTGYFE